MDSERAQERGAEEDAKPSPGTFASEGQRLLAGQPGSLSRLASQLGVVKQVVHRWRTGERVPGEKARADLLRVFGIPVDLWDLAPEVECEPAEIEVEDDDDDAPRAGAGPSTWKECQALIERFRADANDPRLTHTQRARAREQEMKALKLRAELEKEQEFFEDRVVREHPFFGRLMTAIRVALKPHPTAARDVAKALDDLLEGEP